ncbi:MAG: iron-containing alcohol dehydrogenase [Bdellovibrionota bacterium]
MSQVNWYSFPTKICFGAEALSYLPAVVAKESYGKCLIVTDAGFSKTPAYQKVLKTLESAGIAFEAFTGVQGNPTEQDVLAGRDAFKKTRCQWVLGLGGGSPLDVAKAIRLMATHSGSVFDYDDALGGCDKITSNVAPFVAIPTTAGTGSEVGRSTVIVDTNTKTKKIIFSPYLLANYVFADPLLTLDLPEKITAATGMDAFTHNIESYLAKGTHPIADSIALGGIRLVSRSLKKACKQPHDVAARADMLMASMMGAIAFQKGLGVTHSLAHPLSTLAGVHHGLANGVMLVPAMRFNSDVSEGRLTDISRLVNAELGRDVRASAENAIEYFSELRDAISIPRNLREVGVKESLVPELTEQAFHDTCWHNNPKPVTKKDLEALYRNAL